MTESNKKPTQPLFALGIVMTIPMILACGPLVGYLIGRYVLVKYFNSPEIVINIFMGLGFVASAIQIYRLIQQLRSIDS